MVFQRVGKSIDYSQMMSFSCVSVARSFFILTALPIDREALNEPNRLIALSETEDIVFISMQSLLQAFQPN